MERVGQKIMINIFKKYINNEQILAFFIGMAYLLGILSIMHLLPSERDLNLGLQMLIIVSIGLCSVWWKKSFKLKKVGWSAVIWLYMSFILLIQPLVNNIIYEDSLIFILATMVFMLVLSITVFQISDKQRFVNTLAWFLLIGSLLHFLTQLAHLFYWDFLFDKLVLPISVGERPTGNIYQPNQAAFIYAMGIASCLYIQSHCNSLQSNTKKLYHTLWYVSLFMLSVGIAICASRGGLVLGVAAIIVFYLLLHKSLKSKLIYITTSICIFMLGYILGASLLESYSETQTAISRIEKGGAILRLYHLQQAWLIFLDHPIFGIGWRNFAAGGLIHAEILPWFILANHSHFIVSQVASELGIVGLLVFIPFIYIIFKRLNFSSKNHNAFVFTVISIISLYSCSEFPLWYFSYLMIFAVFLALIDIELKQLHRNVKPLFFGFILLSMVSSVYYYQAFMRYNKVAEMIVINKNDVSQNQFALNNLDTPFGFIQFKELMLFSFLPVSTEQLKQKISLGQRVTTIYTSPELLSKQATLLALDGKNREALSLYRASCLYDFGQQCDSIDKLLSVANKEKPLHFGKIYKAFFEWRHANPEKTGLTKELALESAANNKDKP